MSFQISPRAKRSGVYPIVDLNIRKKELLQHGVRLYDFGIGDDSLTIDSELLARFHERLPETTRYPLVEGTLSLRKAIADYLKRRFEVSLDVEQQIISITGSKEAIYHLPTLFFEPGLTKDTVIGPNLGYPPYPKGTEMAGANYYPVVLSPQNGFLLELNSVPDEILKRTALVWLNYPHNPTGATCDREYYKRQIEVARQYDIVLCSDECYADVYFGKPPVSILEVSVQGVLAFHSLSKRSGLTGWRCGFLAGDQVLIQEYKKLRNTIGVATPEPIQLLSEIAWSDDQHVVRRNRIFAQMREEAEALFQKLSLNYFKSDATFYYWIEAPRCRGETSYFEHLFQAGIVVTPSEFFDEGLLGWFRISLVTTPQELKEALTLWEQVHLEAVL